MAGNHKRSTIKVDGKKLKSLLENTTGKDIYTLSVENGFSRNLINEACRKGYASAVVQNIAKLYGITPEAYEIKDPEPEKKGQITFDDLIPFNIDPELFKVLLKEAMIEALQSFNYLRVTGVSYDHENKRFKLFVNEEDLR